ncbi:FecR domain-containing protein [Devosia sp. Root685]|uniref:FecR family protein n=1 Tax=Devosia sp. Root685 TaxID=1736587 RepID=UPI000A4B0FB7|nr:FecR family protein [Devosia sp. Root685]
MRRLALNAAVLFCASLLFAGSAQAAEGRAVGVDPDALVRFSGTDRILAVGADISLGEQVVTGPSGQVQIVFSDQTRLVVGPGSALVIEAYLFNGQTADKFAINALAGSFRFISGHSPKSAYSITTPTASIAVRGTKFDFNVSRPRTDLMLYEGAVRLCSTSGQCQELISRCDLGTVDASVSQLINHRDPLHPQLSGAFRYARFQTPLLGEFRVSGAGKCTEPRQEQGVPETLTTPGGGDPSTPTTTTTTTTRVTPGKN